MTTSEAVSGFLNDYISGEKVRATPEEVDAVQVFARRLVEDHGYPVTHIQTRPQFRVRKRPSDVDKSYPVDIAVFSSDRRLDDDLFIIVECKKKERKDGVEQLKIYMSLSPAELGVWFNGDEHVYLRKATDKKGRQTYTEIPSVVADRVIGVALCMHGKSTDLRSPVDGSRASRPDGRIALA